MKVDKVLLVDDDASIRRIAEIVLSKLKNWKIIQAESGTKALEILKEEKPDVVLMDVMMPKMDGVTAFNKMKESGYEMTPVIFMTAKVQNREVAAYKEMGAAGVITKPFAPAELPGQIERILEEWAGRGNPLCFKP